MNKFSRQFRDWMDGHDPRLRAEEVGRALDVSPQTIRNWRSSGVPDRKMAAVLRIMREWDTTAGVQMGNRLCITASDEQFRAWNQAAISEEGGPYLLEEWAKNGLDKMANDYSQRPRLYEFSDEDSSKVADDPPEGRA